MPNVIMKYRKKMKDEKEYIEIVKDLNERWFDKYGESSERFYYTTDGYINLIGYGNNVVLWNSDNDERKFDEDLNEYEDLSTYIIKTFNAYTKSFSKFNL